MPRFLRLIALLLRARAPLTAVALALAVTACGSARTTAPAERGAYGDRRYTPEVPPYRAPGTMPPPAPMAPPLAAGGPGGKTTVALLLPLSGQLAPLGEAMLNAANMAVFDIGGSGFTLLPRDTRGTPDGAAAATREVVGQGAKLILGPLLATEITAAAAAARSSGVPIVGFSNDRSVTGSNVFTMGFLPAAEVRRVVGYAGRKGLRRYGLLGQDTPYGRLAAQATEEAVNRSGGALLRTETASANADAAEFGRAAQALSGSGPFDAVMIPIFGDALPSAAAALGQNGIDPARTRYLGTAQWEQTPFFSEPALAGAWIAAVPPAARQDFERRYATTYGGPPPRLATLAYDATAMAAALAAQPGGGRYDTATLTSSRGFTGADGFFRFASDGTAERGLAVLEVTPNGLRVIDPAPTRSEELLF